MEKVVIIEKWLNDLVVKQLNVRRTVTRFDGWGDPEEEG